jgi:steroid 5-alpha reductase family enzyme
MSHKFKTLVWMGVLYLFAVTIGVFVFQFASSETLIIRLLIADLATTLVIWIFSLALHNASVYDPYWSVIPVIMLTGVIIHLNPPITLSIVLLYTAVLTWGVRLTYNWAKNWTGFKEQDWRYTMIYQKSPKLYFLSNLFGIQLFPTLIVFVQLIGATYFIQSIPKVNVFTLVGFIIIVGSACIQFISDQQMSEFKLRTKGQKKCIEEGLWKYSRHPNYFGEVMVWYGVYIMYFGTVQKIDILFIAPILMNALFLFISIPMMEKKILSTRPEYKDYQNRVSMLVPFPRKNELNDVIQEDLDKNH